LVQNKVKCPLCNLDLNEEKVFYEDEAFVILRTKNLKGHHERIMIVLKAHEHSIGFKGVEGALYTLERVCKRLFGYAPKWVIMDNTFATIREHWHLVASDLNPKSEDFNQILLTKWLKVVDNVNP